MKIIINYFVIIAVTIWFFFSCYLYHSESIKLVIQIEMNFASWQRIISVNLYVVIDRVSQTVFIDKYTNEYTTNR